MLTKTDTIILNVVPYSDNSLILNLLTEELGKVSCMARVSHSKSAKNRSNILQAGNILSCIIKLKEKSNVQQLRDFEVLYAYGSVQSLPQKMAVLMFLLEVLQKTIAGNDIDKSLFSFVKTSFMWFDKAEKTSNFHLIFLVKLTQFLGFMPNTELSLLSEKVSDKFDIVEIVDNILSSEAFYPEINIVNGKSRSEFLDLILEFYNLNLPNPVNFKSLDVLKAIF